jgi:hypothetical protein
MSSVLEDVIDCQSRLIAALDARAVDSIEAESLTLAKLLKDLPDEPIDAAHLGHARKQSEAARIRVNILSDWNRQRIDRLAELRGQGAATPTGTYAKPRPFNARA